MDMVEIWLKVNWALIHKTPLHLIKYASHKKKNKCIYIKWTLWTAYSTVHSFVGKKTMSNFLKYSCVECTLHSAPNTRSSKRHTKLHLQVDREMYFTNSFKSMPNVPCLGVYGGYLYLLPKFHIIFTKNQFHKSIRVHWTTPYAFLFQFFVEQSISFSFLLLTFMDLSKNKSLWIGWKMQ